METIILFLTASEEIPGILFAGIEFEENQFDSIKVSTVADEHDDIVEQTENIRTKHKKATTVASVFYAGCIRYFADSG